MKAERSNERTCLMADHDTHQFTPAERVLMDARAPVIFAAVTLSEVTYGWVVEQRAIALDQAVMEVQRALDRLRAALVEVQWARGPVAETE